MEQPIFSVSDCIALINQTLEYAYPTIVIEGEVSSFKISKNKFVFFDIKDDEAALGCFMMVYSLRLALEDGMCVRLTAQPRLTAWGKFSLTVREVQPVGEGTIKRSFELLKQKLGKEGLFDDRRKRLLPEVPWRISLVASTESAGYADFLKILRARWPGVDVEVGDVQVQGSSAGEQIVRAIQYFNEQPELADVLVLVRGGGSLEDLAVFNEEPLVRAVAASRIPTLVGVGHEVDESLCDLAADVRASTPSNAAELLVPDRREVLSRLTTRQVALAQQVESRVTAHLKDVGHTLSRVLARLTTAFSRDQQRVQYMEQLLSQLDPRAAMRRGYGLVRDTQGRIVRDATRLSSGDMITIELEKFLVNAGVNNVQKK